MIAFENENEMGNQKNNSHTEIIAAAAAAAATIAKLDSNIVA